MATVRADADTSPLGPPSGGHELRTIPRIHLQQESPDLSRSNSFPAAPLPAVTPDPEGRPACFVSKDGAVGGNSYNETKVDVVLVPCPGANAHDTWTRDRLQNHVFERLATKHHQFKEIGRHLVGSTRLHPALPKVSRAIPSWTRSGIRAEVDYARVLTYQHAILTDGLTLKRLADDLLRTLLAERDAKSRRPLFFICHSIGGLVVKLALTEASRNSKYQSILEHCYGVTFFATPHQGSSYLSMSQFAVSIQQLLVLPEPFPVSLRNELQLGHPLLLSIDDGFKQLSSEMYIWTFYETQDSKLSGGGISGPTDIQFTAPITSMRSAILGVRHEKVYTLQSKHADCASFGMANMQTMKVYLKDLGNTIRKAHRINSEITSNPLKLEQKVQIEVHGFYENVVASSTETAAIRAFSTKQVLASFLETGPDEMLERRLNDIEPDVPAMPAPPDPRKKQFIRHRSGRIGSLLVDPGGGTSERRDPKKDRRASVASVPTRSAREPSPTPPSPRSRDTHGVDIKQGVVETPNTTPTILGDEHPATSGQTPSLRPDYFPSFPTFDPNYSISRSTTGSETIVSDGSSATTIRPANPRGETNERHLGQNIHLQAPINSSAQRRRRGSESTFNQDMRVSFSKPDRKTRKFIWVHLPFNNPSWVKKVFDTLSVKEGRDFSDLFSPEHWSSRHARGRHSQHHACYLKSACVYIPLKPSLEFGSPGLGSPRVGSALNSQGCLYLYFPFIHFDSYKTLIKRRDMIKARMTQGRTKPVPASVAKTESLEQRVIWEFLGHDLPINCRRTLDQYRYPSLHDTRARDDDQMLYKMTKERLEESVKWATDGYMSGPHGDERAYTHRDLDDDESADERGDDEYHKESEAETVAEGYEDEEIKPEDDILNGNVLMVDQLWLWVIDTTSLVTFFPKREGDLMEGPLYQQADLRDSIFNEVNADLTRRCENALDLAALTVLHAVTVLIDRSSHPDLEIFRIFEEAISILTEKMTSSLKRFRTAGFRTKYGEDESLETKTTSIRARHKREDERAEKENRDNTSALLELRDIEDELSTLHHLFEEQEKQIRDMLTLYSPTLHRHDSASTTMPSVDTTNGIAFLQEALAKLSTYKDQADDMIKRVQQTRKDFDKLLETVQRQAQIDEVRLSRQQADLASAQNRSVMIFTTFTVIFLPLTFFTGLFGMNTNEWGGGDFLHLKTIGAITIPASAVLILGALIVAWSTSVRKSFKYLRRKIQRSKAKARRWWLGKLSTYKKKRKPRSVIGREMFRRRREEMEVKKQRKRLKREMTMHDFWERHRLERELEYKIPSRNRKSVSVAKAKARAKAKKENKEMDVIWM